MEIIYLYKNMRTSSLIVLLVRGRMSTGEVCYKGCGLTTGEVCQQSPVGLTSVFGPKRGVLMKVFISRSKLEFKCPTARSQRTQQHRSLIWDTWSYLSWVLLSWERQGMFDKRLLLLGAPFSGTPDCEELVVRAEGVEGCRQHIKTFGLGIAREIATPPPLDCLVLELSFRFKIGASSQAVCQSPLCSHGLDRRALRPAQDSTVAFGGQLTL